VIAFTLATLWLETRGRFGLGTFWLGDVLTWDVLTKKGRFGLGTFWLGDVLTGKRKRQTHSQTLLNLRTLSFQLQSTSDTAAPLSYYMLQFYICIPLLGTKCLGVLQDTVEVKTIFSVNWCHIHWPSFGKGENKGSVLLWYTVVVLIVLFWCFWCVKYYNVVSVYWNIVWWGCENDINQLTFVFPFAKTRSIKRMWRQLTERVGPPLMRTSAEHCKIVTVSFPSENLFNIILYVPQVLMFHVHQ